MGNAQSSGGKEDQRRENIAKEILSTETTYVSSLKIVPQLFMTPLLQGNVKNNFKGVIPPEESKVLFSNWLVLLELHKDGLLEEIKTRVERWSPSTNIGDVFVKYASKFEVYVEYVNHFNEQTALLSELEKRSAVAKVLQEAVTNAECTQPSLGSFLIMPVQRIPRYVMLVSDLLKHTPASHSDHANLMEAEKKLKTMALHINEEKRNYEHQKELHALDQSLLEGSLQAKGRYLVAQQDFKLTHLRLNDSGPSPKKDWFESLFSSEKNEKEKLGFKHEGYLSVEKSGLMGMKKWEKRFCVLTYHQLHLYESADKKDVKGIIYLIKGSKFLSTEELKKEKLKPECFVIETADQRWVLSDDSQSSRVEWSKHLSKVIADGQAVMPTAETIKETQQWKSSGSRTSMDHSSVSEIPLKKPYRFILCNDRFVVTSPTGSTPEKYKVRINNELSPNSSATKTDQNTGIMVVKDTIYTVTSQNPALLDDWIKKFTNAITELNSTETKQDPTVWDSVLSFFKF
eukprot:Lithocolla_globosa_v1_NODE_2731_length_1889_cov_10.816249.p1 type:complete len:515 gc:universal NODE_2731_length_1889_cov_10.816249:213-1757(+)